MADSITVTNPGLYTVSVKNTCHTFYDTVLLELFKGNFNLGNDTNYCFASDFKLAAPFYNNYQYKWQDGSTENNFNAKRNGQFIVTMGYGRCQSSDTINILADISTDKLYIPNAFTPDGNELNDYFPFKDSEKPIDIEIYNRWGEKVYENIKTVNGWNGMYQNKMVECGIYLYRIRYKDCSNRNVFVNGTFTVMY